MDDAHVQVGLDDGALWLRLDRPGARNALTDDMTRTLAEQLEGCTSRAEVRVVVIAGSADAFCAGADIGGAEAHERFDVGALDAANRLIRAIVALDKPVVAAVEGVAAGVGVSMALACDLLVAAESARFVLSFARIGLMPDGGSTATVAASIGRAQAMRLALLAEPLSAEEAYAAGLVSHLVPAAEYATTLDRLVRTLAAGPPLAYAAAKRAVNAASLGQLDGALERERTAQTLLLRTRDVAEGMAAFSEKRPARFTGA